VKRLLLIAVFCLVALVVGGFFAAREVAQSSNTVGTSGLTSPAPSALWEADIRNENPSFSVAAGGPSGLSPADILNRASPPSSITCAQLGLGFSNDCVAGNHDDVDALSYGYDFFWPMKPYWKWLFFSVAPGAQGLPGSAVAVEAACSPAEPQADEFWSSAQSQLNTNGQYYDGDGVACNPAQSNPGMGLQEKPTSDDLDALDEYPYPPLAIKYVFFTLKPGAASLAFLGATSADILSNVVPAVGAPKIYASRLQLGLLANDKIDALCLKDYDDSYTNNGPNEKLWFSLKPGSPTLTNALPNYTPGDILEPVGAGVRPVLKIDHSRLGLAASDDVDALKCAQIGAQVDKAVTDIGFDTAADYPNDGPQLPDHPTKHLPYVAVTTSEQKVISVTSVDVNLSSTEVDDALGAFYADIPPGCQGRWWDQGTGGPWFTYDTYSVGGDPDGAPFSTDQLGQEDTHPEDKKNGDSDPAYPNNTYEVDLHFQTGDYGTQYVEEAGLAVYITRFFDLGCPWSGQHHFWFCNKIEPKDYIDPLLTNNVRCEEMVVESTGPDPTSTPTPTATNTPTPTVTRTPTPTVPVGGLGEFPSGTGAQAAESSAPEGTGSSAGRDAALAAGVAAALLTLGAGAWYARRRWVR